MSNQENLGKFSTPTAEENKRPSSYVQQSTIRMYGRLRDKQEESETESASEAERRQQNWAKKLLGYSNQENFFVPKLTSRFQIDIAFSN